MDPRALQTWLAESFEGKVAPVAKAKAAELREFLEHSVGDNLVKVVENETVCRLVFQKLYELLPAPVRLLVPRETFTSYCIEHKTRLLGWIGVESEPA